MNSAFELWDVWAYSAQPRQGGIRCSVATRGLQVQVAKTWIDQADSPSAEVQW